MSNKKNQEPEDIEAKYLKLKKEMAALKNQIATFELTPKEVDAVKDLLVDVIFGIKEALKEAEIDDKVDLIAGAHKKAEIEFVENLYKKLSFD